MTPPPITPGSVWMVELDEGNSRPCVVVSREQLNRGTSVLVVPCTSSGVEQKMACPDNVFLAAGSGGLRVDSVARTHMSLSVEVDSLRE